MKKYVVVLLLLLTTAAWSQDSTKVDRSSPASAAFQRHSFMPTVSLGFINSYKNSYEVPANFEKGTTTGFSPVFIKLEYGISRRVSLALTTSFNTIYYNSSQIYTGYNGPILRNRANKLRMFSIGLSGFYHFGHIININRLDPFIGVGLSLNNQLYTAFPQGDSTVIKKSHTATPYLKAGARYYISNKISLFGDVGYDKLSLISLGLSCRVMPKKG